MTIVTIANERLYGKEDHGEDLDLSTEEGRNGIYEYAENLDQQGDLDVITESYTLDWTTPLRGTVKLM